MHIIGVFGYFLPSSQQFLHEPYNFLFRSNVIRGYSEGCRYGWRGSRESRHVDELMYLPMPHGILCRAASYGTTSPLATSAETGPCVAVMRGSPSGSYISLFDAMLFYPPITGIIGGWYEILSTSRMRHALRNSQDSHSCTFDIGAYGISSWLK